MDIRNFFGSSKASAKTKKKKTSNGTTSTGNNDADVDLDTNGTKVAKADKKNATTANTNTTTTTTTTTANTTAKARKTASKTTNKKTKTPPPKDPEYNSGSDTTMDHDDDDDDKNDDTVTTAPKTRTRKSTTTSTTTTAATAATTTRRTSPRSKKKENVTKKRKLIIMTTSSDDDDDDDDDDDMVNMKPKPKEKKVTTTTKSKKTTSKKSNVKEEKKYNHDMEEDEDDNKDDNSDDGSDDDDDFRDDGGDDFDDDFDDPPPKKKTRAPSSSTKKTATTTTTKTNTRTRSSARTTTNTNTKDKPNVKPTIKKQTKTTTRKKTTTPQPKKKKVLIKPLTSITKYTIEDNVTNTSLFNGITFVMTGILESISRDDMIDYIKILGGRVTTAVSSKTNYLIIGTILEDGREVEEGSKYRRAIELGEDSISILSGEGMVYALAEMLDDDNDGNDGNGGNVGGVKKEETNTMSNPYANKKTSTSTIAPSTITSSSSTIVNPYAKNSSSSAVSNPYAKPSSSSSAVRNPYASPSMRNPYKNTSSSSLPSSGGIKKEPSSSSSSSSIGGGRANVNDPNALWADKYAPNDSSMILGNKDNVNKLRGWLTNWENHFVKAQPKGKKRPFNPKTGPFKAALLSGPPGIGKTTTATLVAEEANRQVLELNASDTRSKKSLETTLGDVTGSQVLNFGKSTGKSSANSVMKRCIIMDEVDGMGAGDRSGMSELIKMIKNSLVPIICICNDRQSQKIKSLAPHCLDLKYRRPTKSMIAKRTIQIGQAEGMNVEYNAAEAVAESCGNDVRQVLNVLQMWSNKKHGSTDKRADMTYKDYKDRDNLVKKDSILRVSLFDATRMLVEGRRGISSETDPRAQLDSLYKRTDAFFVDYSLMGLMVHQNYLKVVNQKYLTTKTKGDMEGELECLKNMYEGTKCMSDFAMAEDRVRAGQNWGLLPLCSVLATKAGYHAGGESGGMLTGFPEFSGWLGKNSSKGKKGRLIQEFSHHMNYKISADNTELRLRYLPAIRNRLSKMLITKGDSNVSGAIEFMDEYGLDRDDVFENIDEFTIDRTVKKFSDVESKVKAAFTREYNKGIHKSQALVDEQGVPTRKRKAVSKKDDESGSENENEAESSESEDDEMDIEELKKMFKKKKGASKKGTTKKGKASQGKRGKNAKN